MAAERTLMAWIRTISMIGFGFREGTLRNEANFSQVVSFSFSWVPNSCPDLTLPA
jgi:uncharacterized membrane protein YidH (DUF202 family)